LRALDDAISRISNTPGGFATALDLTAFLTLISNELQHIQAQMDFLGRQPLPPDIESSLDRLQAVRRLIELDAAVLEGIRHLVGYRLGQLKAALDDALLDCDDDALLKELEKARKLIERYRADLALANADLERANKRITNATRRVNEASTQLLRDEGRLHTQKRDLSVFLNSADEVVRDVKRKLDARRAERTQTTAAQQKTTAAQQRIVGATPPLGSEVVASTKGQQILALTGTGLTTDRNGQHHIMTHRGRANIQAGAHTVDTTDDRVVYETDVGAVVAPRSVLSNRDVQTITLPGQSSVQAAPVSQLTELGNGDMLATTSSGTVVTVSANAQQAPVSGNLVLVQSDAGALVITPATNTTASPDVDSGTEGSGSDMEDVQYPRLNDLPNMGGPSDGPIEVPPPVQPGYSRPQRNTSGVVIRTAADGNFNVTENGIEHFTDSEGNDLTRDERGKRFIQSGKRLQMSKEEFAAMTRKGGKRRKKSTRVKSTLRRASVRRVRSARRLSQRR